eukprot:9475123-Pyramimonas_sp.AAC.1
MADLATERLRLGGDIGNGVWEEERARTGGAKPHVAARRARLTGQGKYVVPRVIDLGVLSVIGSMQSAISELGAGEKGSRRDASGTPAKQIHYPLWGWGWASGSPLTLPIHGHVAGPTRGPPGPA